MRILRDGLPFGALGGAAAYVIGVEVVLPFLAAFGTACGVGALVLRRLVK